MKTAKEVAAELAQFLGVTEDIPITFDGVPLLNNQNSWFFAYDEHRNPDDIDTLWEFLPARLLLQITMTMKAGWPLWRLMIKPLHAKTYKWNLSMGLFWARPWFFPTLDGQSRLLYR